MVDKQSIRPDKTKWVKTRKCGCGECTFYSVEERGECPLKNDPGAIWLYVIAPGMLGCKDYIDPLDFAPPTAFNEKKEEAEPESET